MTTPRDYLEDQLLSLVSIEADVQKAIKVGNISRVHRILSDVMRLADEISKQLGAASRKSIDSAVPPVPHD